MLIRAYSVNRSNTTRKVDNFSCHFLVFTVTDYQWLRFLRYSDTSVVAAGEQDQSDEQRYAMRSVY